MNDSTRYRLGRREANLRAVNERVVEAIEGLRGGGSGVFTIVCECSREQCSTVLRVPRDVFGRVREHDTHFIVATGHVLMEIETDIEQGSDWSVVAKRGVAAVAAVEEREDV